MPAALRIAWEGSAAVIPKLDSRPRTRGRKVLYAVTS